MSRLHHVVDVFPKVEELNQNPNTLTELTTTGFFFDLLRPLKLFLGLIVGVCEGHEAEDENESTQRDVWKRVTRNEGAVFTLEPIDARPKHDCASAAQRCFRGGTVGVEEVEGRPDSGEYGEAKAQW